MWGWGVGGGGGRAFGSSLIRDYLERECLGKRLGKGVSKI